MPPSPAVPGGRFDAPADFALPDFSDLVDSIEASTESVEETYYDTASKHLDRVGMALRRSKSSAGAQWQLTIPGGRDRRHAGLRSDLELVFESRATTPPREVSALLLAIRGGERLVGSVRLGWSRDAQTLLDADGETVVAIHDDSVRSSALGSEQDETAWRQIEVYSGSAATKSAHKAIRQRLCDAGAKPTTNPSKVERVAAEASSTSSSRKRLAGLVDDYLQAQLAIIAWGDLSLRLDFDVVHATRVAIRRLRSTLAVYREVFDGDMVDVLDRELTWYAGLLGAVRDCDVTGKRVSSDLAELPGKLVVGAVVEQVDDEIRSERAAAVEALRAGMASRKYVALVALLERWRIDAPYSSEGKRRRKSAATNVSAAQKVMRKRLRGAVKADAPDDHVHRARKAAKRVHYAAELATPVLGKKEAKQIIKVSSGWQRRLGEFQDSRLAADLLYRLGARAEAGSGSSGFTYGLLMAQELRRSEQIRAAVRRALRVRRRPAPDRARSSSSIASTSNEHQVTHLPLRDVRS